MTTGLRTKLLICLLITAKILVAPTLAQAETTLVAVASNFAKAAQKLSTDFSEKTGHTVKISTGSTGQLYAQIKHGAPFDIFLAADAERPEKLEADGIAVSGSRFTYAVGQLVWWHRNPFTATTDQLVRNEIGTVAFANPKLAPYGRAAQQIMEKKPAWFPTHARLVYGQNIAQTYAMVASGNADAGIIARSQVETKLKTVTAHLGRAATSATSEKIALDVGLIGLGMILIDPKHHDPIRQDAILLQRAKDNPAALAFLAFLKTPETRKTIASFGYLEGGE